MLMRAFLSGICAALAVPSITTRRALRAAGEGPGLLAVVSMVQPRFVPRGQVRHRLHLEPQCLRVTAGGMLQRRPQFPLQVLVEELASEDCRAAGLDAAHEHADADRTGRPSCLRRDSSSRALRPAAPGGSPRARAARPGAAAVERRFEYCAPPFFKEVGEVHTSPAFTESVPARGPHPPLRARWARPRVRRIRRVPPAPQRRCRRRLSPS